MNKDDIERKVKALLAKAEDEAVGSEESEALASKAEFLMRKYSIEKLTQNNPFGEIVSTKILYSEELTEPGYLSNPYICGAGRIVRELKTIELLYTPNRTGKRVIATLYGERDDIEMAKSLVTSVWRQAQMYRRSWIHSEEFYAYRDDLKDDGFWTNSWAQNIQKSYVQGFHAGYADKMEELAHDSGIVTEAGSELELARLDRIRKFMPNFRTTHTMIKSYDGYISGAADGSRADHGRDVNSGSVTAIGR